MSQAQPSQGRKANVAGSATDQTVHAHLVTHAGLLHRDSKTLEGFLSSSASGLFGPLGDFVKDVQVAEDGFLGIPFRAKYVVRRRDWPAPLILFYHSQVGSGTTQNAVARFLHNLTNNYQSLPGAIVLIGSRWESDRKAADWLCRFVRTRGGKKFLRVFVGLAEFREWIDAGMPWPREAQNAFA